MNKHQRLTPVAILLWVCSRWFHQRHLLFGLQCGASEIFASTTHSGARGWTFNRGKIFNADSVAFDGVDLTALKPDIVAVERTLLGAGWLVNVGARRFCQQPVGAEGGRAGSKGLHWSGPT